MFPVVGEPHTNSVLQLLRNVERLHVVDGLVNLFAISISVRVCCLEYVAYLNANQKTYSQL